ncbi:MAG: Inward rectifier potassium channel Irk [Bacteroidetes bacterium]|nr:MAG: Inward rectifier potassium channel Irk [Bacteroidota bacterium]
MAFLKRINSKATSVGNSGFGHNGTRVGGRLFKKNGKANLKKTGIPFLDGISWYHAMLELPTWRFLLLIFVAYLVINFVFAVIYLAIGVQYIVGMAVHTPMEKFWEAYFFSAQTFTTVGYGRLSPSGFLMSFVASFEALLGLLSSALATGLFYGRFSRPRAFVLFSNVAVMAPYKNDVAFMCRMAPYKNNELSDAEVKMILALTLYDDGKEVNRFYPLSLEMDKINALTLNWTVVHPIDEKSPFYGLSRQDLEAAKAEVLVFLKAFDDTFSATVVDRTSYQASEIAFGAKFLPMYERSATGGTTRLELDKIHRIMPADISFSTVLKTDDARFTAANA